MQGGLQGFLSICDYFFAMYSFSFLWKGVWPTGKFTCRNKCHGYSVNFPLYSKQYLVEIFFGIKIPLPLVAQKVLVEEKVKYL